MTIVLFLQVGREDGAEILRVLSVAAAASELDGEPSVQVKCARHLPHVLPGLARVLLLAR